MRIREKTRPLYEFRNKKPNLSLPCLLESEQESGITGQVPIMSMGGKIARTNVSAYLPLVPLAHPSRHFVAFWALSPPPGLPLCRATLTGNPLSGMGLTTHGLRAVLLSETSPLALGRGEESAHSCRHAGHTHHHPGGDKVRVDLSPGVDAGHLTVSACGVPARTYACVSSPPGPVVARPRLAA